ncbi:interleukin-12 subunit alpha [Xyrichtys novacula]|nr:interleukin-12 subunit alpha [Xyrichtys novacula]
MALNKHYFSAALMLLLLTCPLWQLSQSVPVMSKGQMTDSCVSYAQTLLQDIATTLTQTDLFKGIDCSKQSVEMNTKTNTGSVCAPQESKCSGNNNPEFNEEVCLTNITADLRHYYQFLSAQPDPNGVLSQSVLSSLRELMENCFTSPLPRDLISQAPDRQSTFDDRLSLCKVLKGFHVRTITINRVISYINSSEHAK